MEQIQNEYLTVKIASKGAELQSIKDAEGREYLWDGDSEYWGRRSPILFPITCGLWKDTYRIDGEVHKMPKHGFCRDAEFEVAGVSKESVSYSFSENKETWKLFPYPFNLGVTYCLEGKELHVIWHVQNTGTETLHFQIGGHPAFRVPGCEKGGELKGMLWLNNPAPVRRFATVEGCLDRDRRETVKTLNGFWKIDGSTFDEDAVIFDECQVQQVTLADEKCAPHVSVIFSSPAVGIWSPTGKNAPFVCIEPWYGVADLAEYEGEFKDRYLINSLLPGASFMSEYTIIIEK